jgi:hypothetical protein
MLMREPRLLIDLLTPDEERLSDAEVYHHILRGRVPLERRFRLVKYSQPRDRSEPPWPGPGSRERPAEAGRRTCSCVGWL